MNNRQVPLLKSLSVRLGLVLFVVVAGAVAIVYVAVVPPLESRLINATFSDLEQASALPADVVGNANANGRRSSYQGLADTFSVQLNARVVIYEALQPPALAVIADSRPGPADGVSSDPIAVAASQTGQLEHGRISRGGQEFAEVARPALAGGQPVEPATTLLVSQPLAERLSAVSVVRRDILIFGGVALAVSWLVGALAALRLTRRIQRLEVAADRIAGGDFEVKIEDTSQDELGQLARTFDQMRERLASLDHARREFIANASHELRTPLFALGGFLELLADEDLDEGTRRDFLETANGQVERLTRLATDLLDLSRLDAGELGLESEPIDLRAAATELVDGFGGLAEATGHVLRLRPPDGDVAAVGDEQRVLQIGRSLIENALRHTPAGTTVGVAVAQEGERVTLSVHDNGPGVRPEDQQHLFERFYRGEGGAAFGSGIGLAIARELAFRMNGTIELVSKPRATTFTLVLPAAPQAAPFPRENALVES